MSDLGIDLAILAAISTATSWLWYRVGLRAGEKQERLKWERSIADLERQTGAPLYDQLLVSFEASIPRATESERDDLS